MDQPPATAHGSPIAIQPAGHSSDDRVAQRRNSPPPRQRHPHLPPNERRIGRRTRRHGQRPPIAIPPIRSPRRPAHPRIDTCGTGGDGASTFNISTAVAFVASAAGVAVAKHGNRSASSKVGSADVLEGLGVNLAAPAEKIRAAVKEVGITFLFAPGWHPAMKAVVPIRKMLKVRTIFNLMGPLVNPLQPTGQVIGVYSPTVLNQMAEALNYLGIGKAIVLHGREKLDEAGLGDLTDLAVLANHQVTTQTIDPQEFGITPAPITALKGGELAENSDILTNVLQGKGTQAQTDAVALNAALALQVGDLVPDTAAGVALAKDILTSGAAWDKLEALVKFLRD